MNYWAFVSTESVVLDVLIHINELQSRAKHWSPIA